jgi:hypothetical protein
VKIDGADGRVFGWSQRHNGEDFKDLIFADVGCLAVVERWAVSAALNDGHGSGGGDDDD